MIGDVLMKHIVMTILGLIIVILLGITGYLGYISNQYVAMNKQINSDLQVANQNLFTFSKVTTDNQKALYETLKENADQ